MQRHCKPQVRATAPADLDTRTDHGPSLAGYQWPTMLTLVPEPEARAIPLSCQDDAGLPWYNGSYTNPDKLPPHLCWTPPGALMLSGEDAENATDGEEWLTPPANETGYMAALGEAMQLSPDVVRAVCPPPPRS